MVAGAVLLILAVAFGVGGVGATAAGAAANDRFALYVTGCGLAMLGLAAIATSGGTHDVSMTTDEGSPARVSAAVRRNLESSVTVTNEQIATQFANSASLDGQLVGLLGFLATSGTLFAVVKHALDSDRVILMVGIFAGAGLCLLGSALPKDLEAGPVPAKSFHEFGGAEAGFSLQLLSDLTATLAYNDTALDQRRGALNAVLIVLFLTVAVYGLARLWLLIE